MGTAELRLKSNRNILVANTKSCFNVIHWQSKCQETEVRAQKNQLVKASKGKSQRNPKGEGHDQGHEMKEGEEDTDQETTDIGGEGIPQVLHPAVQILILHTDLINKGRRVRLKD